MQNNNTTQQRYGRVILTTYINIKSDDLNVEGPTKLVMTEVYDYQVSLAIANYLNRENKNINSCYSVEELFLNAENQNNA